MGGNPKDFHEKMNGSSPLAFDSFSKTNEFSAGIHGEEIETAVRYLILREIGCSRENALSYTNRKRSDQGNFASGLPMELRSAFKNKLTKSRCVPYLKREDDEGFESISTAFKELMKKKQSYSNVEFVERSKYIEQLESDVKMRIRKSPDDTKAEPSSSLNTNKKELKRGESKINVPETGKTVGYHSLNSPQNFTHKSHCSLNSGTFSTRQGKIKINKHENLKKKIESKTLKHMDHSQQLEHFNSQASSQLLSPKYQGISHGTSLLSIFQDQKSTETKPSLLPKELTPLKNRDPINESKAKILEFSKTAAPLSSNSSSQDHLTRLHSIFESPEEMDNAKLLNLVQEDKKLVNLIRLQKYRIAQKKAEENAKCIEKSQQRKRQLDALDAENRLRKFEQKKQKIKNAVIRKESLILAKVKNSKGPRGLENFYNTSTGRLKF